MTKSVYAIVGTKYPHPDRFRGDKAKYIIELVCDHFGVTEKEIKGKDRSRPIIFARHLAMYLIRTYCRELSLKGMGKMFGGKDHSSVIHAFNETQSKIHIDPTDPVTEAYHSIIPKIPF